MSFTKKYLSNASGELVPQGVTLSDPDDFSEKRKEIFDTVAESFKGSFPRTYGKVRMELNEVDYEDPENVSPEMEYDAKREDKFLHRRLRGNIKLLDAETGELLDQKKVTLAKVPTLTDRGVFVHNGTDYTAAYQARLIPGIFHLKRSSGDVAAQFNTKRGTGPGFSISLEPSTGIYRMEVGGAKIPLYSVLSKLGYSDQDMENAWGRDLLEVNRQKSTARDWPKAVAKLARRRASEAGDDETKQVALVREILDGITFNRDAVALTLPSLVQKNS